MPLTGGAADKVGNRFERRWTVLALLDVIESRAQSLQVEVPGEAGFGAEFRIVAGGVPAWHQVKRQRAGGPWTIASLANEGVLASWWGKIQDGGRCVFVSSTGAQELVELVERASQAECWAVFDGEFLDSAAQRARFERLRGAWGNPSGEEAYEALGRVEVHLIDESKLAALVEARLAALVEGLPSVAAAVLGQLVDDSTHRVLTSGDVWARLAENGVAPRNLSGNAVAVKRLAERTESFSLALGRRYVNRRRLPRREAAAAFAALVEARRVLVSGGAGIGKSVIVGEVAELATQAGWAVLALAVDDLPEATGTHVLGEALVGREESPVTVLAAVAAGGGDALLVLDQFDAISTMSGRYQKRSAIVEDLLTEAARHPNLRVLIACRQFDLDNDRDLRVVATASNTTVVTAAPLEESEVRRILTEVGVTTGLSAALVSLLTVPLHLAIYVELFRAGDMRAFEVRSLTDLYEQYWKVKRAACQALRHGSDQWVEVIHRLVDLMNDRQELAMPVEMLDDLDQQVAAMASEGVLTMTPENRVKFFHETFFDYCFARTFIFRNGSLRDLLRSGEQGLFRRAQIRPVLEYERVTAPSVYRSDLVWLLNSPEVRPHIKVLVVALVQTMIDPRSAEWEVLEPIATDTRHPLHTRLWQALRASPGWFPVLHEARTWSTCLGSSDPELVGRVWWALTGMSGTYGDEVAALLACSARDELWAGRLHGFFFQAEIGPSRRLFTLLLEAVGEGYYDEHGRDLWYVLQRLVVRMPEFAVEALSVLFARALSTGIDNPFAASGPLAINNRAVASDKTVKSMAVSAPAAFVEQLLPHILEVARRNACPDLDEDILRDVVWGYHIYNSRTSLAHELLAAMSSALRAVSHTDPGLAKRVFDRLRSDSHETAWFLLACGYAGNPARFADDAADWLAATPGALRLGYTDEPHRVSRELIEVVSPRCGDLQLGRLVDAVMEYVPPFERTYQGLRARGYAQLGLLNAVDTARIPQKASRRLAELRRKFLSDDVSPPRGIRAGSVPPPVPETAARRMTDRQWLRAMERYNVANSLEFGPDGRLIGNAGTQAQVLETLTRESPERFARLLLHLSTGIAPAYVGAIMSGLTDSHLDEVLLVEVCRHAHLIGGCNIGSKIAALIEAQAARTLPEPLLDIVIAIAHTPAGDGGVDMHQSDASAVRSAAASAIRALIHQDHDRLPRFEETLTRLAGDPTLSVREMAVFALAAVLGVDAPLAFRLFHSSISAEGSELLASQYVEHFLYAAVRCGHFPQVADLLPRMTASNLEQVRLAGARLAVFASYQIPDLDPLVDTLLDSEDESVPAAIVKVVADNTTTRLRRERAFELLTGAFTDPSPEVREAAITCFYSLEGERLSDYEQLLTAFGTSPAFDHDTSAVFHVLESSRHPLPSVVIDLCERFTAGHQAALGDLSTAAAGAGIYVSSLVIRLLAQHTDPHVRTRCLDLIDQLVLAGAHGIDDSLDKIER